MIVVDASLALKWLVEEERSDEAIGWAAEQDQLIAPTLMRIEVANALFKKARDGDIHSGAVPRAFASLSTFITEWTELNDVVDHALLLALELRHSVYDCCYLALAEQREVQVATADLELIRRCRDTRAEHLILDW